MSAVLDNRRLRLIYFTIFRRADNVRYPNWFQNTLGPGCVSFARNVLAREECDGEFRIFYFKHRPEPVYFPADIDAFWFKSVVGESRRWHWHYYEIPETVLEPGDVVFDCGAAEGLFAWNAAPRVAKVVCFEPASKFVRCLRRTFAAFSNISIVGMGLSDHPGSAWLEANNIESTVSTTGKGEPVELTTIDAYAAQTGIVPTYIKADLEGDEHKMLMGAEKILGDRKPRLAITTYHFPGDSGRLVSLIRRLNPRYRILQKGAEHHRGDPLMVHAW